MVWLRCVHNLTLFASRAHSGCKKECPVIGLDLLTHPVGGIAESSGALGAPIGTQSKTDVLCSRVGGSPFRMWRVFIFHQAAQPGISLGVEIAPASRWQRFLTGDSGTAQPFRGQIE
jgi:hypothetical protein